MATAVAEVSVVTASDLLKNWQGHRRLTRRVIEAFPEDKLFEFSVGGMRPFADLAWEFIRMAVPIAEGVATGTWQEFKAPKATSKSELLRLWDEHTARLDAVFAQADERRAAGAAAPGIPFRGMFLEAPLAVRLERVGARSQDASDADAAVARAQESYDLGEIGWRRVDASGSPADTLARAREALRGC